MTTAIDWQSMTLTALRQEVRRRGLARGAAVVSARKADLIDLLEGRRESLESPTLPASPDQPAPPAAAPAFDENRVRVIAREEIEQHKPRPIVVEMPDRSMPTIDPNAHHHELERVVRKLRIGFINQMWIGPAGTGKTTLARHLAEVLGRDFGFLSMSGGIGEHHILGRTLPDASGAWLHQDSDFIRIYRDGGVFLIDEFDAADPNVVVSINAALANDVIANPYTPGTIITRHPDCVIIAAGNTFGHGADSMYVGRNPIDAASLDRFVLSVLAIDYDDALEMRIARGLGDDIAADNLIAWVRGLRADIKRHNLRRIASTRLIVAAVRELAAGSTMDDIKRDYFVSWSDSERAKVGA